MDNDMLNRFIGLCGEVNADAKALIGEPPPMLAPMIREWMLGRLNDVEMMRSLRNLVIFNPKYSIVHQGEIID